MSKNVKSIFLVATLLFLLVGVSAISASEVSDDTTVLEDTADTVASEVTTTTTDNKIVDTTTKNIKTEEQSTDLYVSDTDGSDNNSGTNTSPLKTLQGAFDKTTAEGTYNIHIAEGTYKGLGNTNLTVNGNYNINIIGEGMNKTVFDGEAKYTINGKTVWGDSDYWNPYTYKNANYFLTITEGTGHITLSNFNIEHMASIGGTNIGAYPHATIDNYANLTVDNIFFYYNMAGIGSAIRNHRSGTVLMTNCLLTENRKSSSSGNDGVIYNNGTITIENTIFDHNAGRWGVILNDHVLDIKDSIMKNGISYDLGSTYKFGSGIASNGGQADFFNIYKIDDVQTTITNVTFENNGQTDIYQGVGTLNVNNCNFINSTGIYINSYVKHNNITPISMVINGSTFKDMQASTYFGSLSVKTGTIFGIYSEGNYQLLIENNTIELQDKGYGIFTNENSVIRNNNLNNYIVINGTNNTISNNIINSTKQVFDIELSPNAEENTIINNTLYSSILTGTKTIKNNTKNNIILDNIPESGDEIILNDENYNEYFDENGKNIQNKLSNGSIVYIESLNDKQLVMDDVKIVLTSYSQNTNLNNVQIKTNPNAKIYLTNLKINNNLNLENLILLNSSDNTINNVRINSTTSKNIIVLEKDYNTLNTITINTNISNDSNVIISVKSSNNELTNMYIKLFDAEDNLDNITIIDLQNTDNNKIFETTLSCENAYGLNKIKSNLTGINCINTTNSLLDAGLNIYRCENAYGIVLINATNNTITRGGTISSDNSSVGILIDSSDNTYLTSSIRVIGNNSNAFIINNSNNTTLTSEDNGFNIQLSGNNSKAIQITNSNYTQTRLLYLHNVDTNSNDSIIDIINSNNNLFEGIDIQIKNNTYPIIQVINSSNSTISSYNMDNEEIPTILTSYDKIIEIDNSDNNIIESITSTSGLNNILITNSQNNSIINSNLTSENNYTIVLDNSNNNQVTDNKMYAMNQTLIGDECVLDNGANNIIENNTPGKYYISDENYNELFTDSLFIHDYYCEIIIASDITNKNLIFPEQVTITNPEKYTLYNTTLTINGDKTTVNDLTFNSTNNENVIIVNGDNCIFNNITISHESENIARSIINKAENTLTFNNLNINTTGAEIETNDNLPSLLSIYSESEAKINNSNINTTYTTSDKKGTTNSIQSHHINITNSNINTLGNNIAIGVNASGESWGQVNITVKSNTTSIGVIGELSDYLFNDSVMLVESNDTAIGQMNSNKQHSHMIVIGENLAIGIYELNNENLQIASYNHNITVKSNKTAYGAYLKDSGIVITQLLKWTLFDENCTMDISGENVTGVYAENLKCPGLYVNNNMTLTGTNVNAVYTNNLTTNNGIQIQQSKIEISTSNITTPVFINNTNNIGRAANLGIQRATIIIKKYNLTTPIITINNTNSQVRIQNNYLYSLGVCGENAISINNTGKINNKNNTPTDANSLVVKININDLKQIYRDANNITLTVTDYDEELLNGTITVDFGPTEEKFENIILENGTANILFTPNATQIQYQLDNDYDVLGRPYSNTNITYLNVSITFTTNESKYASPQIFTISSNGIKVIKHNITLTTTNITGILNKPIQVTTTVVDEFNRPVNEGIIKYMHGTDIMGQAPVINGVATTSILFNNSITNIYAEFSESYNYANKLQYNIRCNIVTPELIVNPITATAGETINISASITAFDETVTDINKGKVTFKVNGKTLKDANGKVIYAKVVNGTATIEDYIVPDDWSKDDTTIQAVYSGSTQCDKLTSQKVNLEVTKAVPTFTTENITASAGDTIQLTATITDGDKVINTGKVVFKINGKTVKDANGKVIYAKVVDNNVNVTYTLPSDMKVKEYNLTVTLISNDYDRLEDIKTLTIIA